jgi:hypothetical protein
MGSEVGGAMEWCMYLGTCSVHSSACTVLFYVAPRCLLLSAAAPTCSLSDLSGWKQPSPAKVHWQRQLCHPAHVPAGCHGSRQGRLRRC